MNMQKIGKTLFGDDAAFLVEFDNADSYFKHVTVGIRYADADNNGDIVYRYDAFKFSDIAITAQADTDCRHFYAACVTVGNSRSDINHRNIGRFYKILKTLNAKAVKHLKSNMSPTTFGQFVFMIGSISGINEVVFKDKHGFNSYILASGCEVLDSRIANLWPHLTEKLDFYPFSEI